MKVNIAHDFSNENRKKTGTTYYASGNLFIIKQTSKVVPNRFNNTVRSSISGFSASSACRMRRYLRVATSEYRYMLTLTYPGFYSSDGKESKEHLRKFLQELKREQARAESIGSYRCTLEQGNPYSSFWFLEFQSRGAPHFHILTTHEFNKKWISRKWFEIVGSDDIRHLQAGTNFEKIRLGRAGIASYAAKYAAKNIQKVVPDGYDNVGRFWGVSGDKSTVAADTFVSHRDMDVPGVASALNRLVLTINMLQSEGFCEVLIKKQGVRVFVLKNRMACEYVRRDVLFLSVKTGVLYDVFSDAELDGPVNVPRGTFDVDGVGDIFNVGAPN